MIEKNTDNEDKMWWVEHGLALEHLFVEEVCPKIGLKAIMNPNKETDPMVHDLFINNKIADLKTQNTPFYTASMYKKSDGTRYNPSRTVTFNYKDLVRYRHLYPHILVAFWVNWPNTEKYGCEVDAINGVWLIDLDQIEKLIDEGRMRIHNYQNRVNDTNGNAKVSYLIDLFDIKEKYLLDVKEVEDEKE